MAKTSTLTTLQPERYSTGAEVFAEDALQAVEMLNYAAQYFPVTHLSMGTGPGGWDGSISPQLTGLVFPGVVDEWHEAIVFGADLALETQELTFGARCVMMTGEIGEVRVTVDNGTTTATATLSFDDADADELSIPVDVSGLVDREVVCTVEFRITAGTSETSYIRDLRLEDQDLDDLPDPPNE